MRISQRAVDTSKPMHHLAMRGTLGLREGRHAALKIRCNECILDISPFFRVSQRLVSRCNSVLRGRKGGRIRDAIVLHRAAEEDRLVETCAHDGEHSLQARTICIDQRSIQDGE